MDGYLPLKPGGSTFAMQGQPTASAAAVLLPGTGEASYIFDNSRNSAAVWIGYGPTSDVAKSNAVIPLLGANQPGVLCVAKTTVQAFTLNAGLYFSVIMELGSGTVTGIGGYGV